MRPIVQGLIKIYPNRKYAEKFLQGEMLARRLSWFRNYKDEDGRADEYEGAAVLPRDGLIFYYEAHDPLSGEVTRRRRITGDDLAGPMIIRPRVVDNMNLYCMYAFHSGGFEETKEFDISAYKEHLRQHERCLKLGDYTVAIEDATEFRRRMQEAIAKRGFQMGCQLVQYYDPDIGISVDPFSREVVFLKQERYSYQREYRFAFDTGTIGTDDLSLDIGPIHDIAFVMKTADINRTLDVKSRPPQ